MSKGIYFLSILTHLCRIALQKGEIRFPPTDVCWSNCFAILLPVIASVHPFHICQSDWHKNHVLVLIFTSLVLGKFRTSCHIIIVITIVINRVIIAAKIYRMLSVHLLLLAYCLWTVFWAHFTVSHLTFKLKVKSMK